jgi:hypothetical protein
MYDVPTCDESESPEAVVRGLPFLAGLVNGEGPRRRFLIPVTAGER